MSGFRNILFSVLVLTIFTGCTVAQPPSPNPPSTTSPTQTPTPLTPLSFTVQTKAFVSTEGNFTIDLYQIPITTRNEIAEKLNGSSGPLFLWKYEKVVYTVTYYDDSELIGDITPEKRKDALYHYDEGIRKAVGKHQGQIISEKPLSLNGHIGTEIQYLANGLKFINRNYLVNKRGYKVQAGFRDLTIESEALRVLDSFKLLNKDSEFNRKK